MFLIFTKQENEDLYSVHHSTFLFETGCGNLLFGRRFIKLCRDPKLYIFFANSGLHNKRYFHRGVCDKICGERPVVGERDVPAGRLELRRLHDNDFQHRGYGSAVSKPRLYQSNLELSKIIRVFRILKPLRFISHNKELKILVNCLMTSITCIMNVSVVIFMIWYILLNLGWFLGYCSWASWKVIWATVRMSTVKVLFS